MNIIQKKFSKMCLAAYNKNLPNERQHNVKERNDDRWKGYGEKRESRIIFFSGDT